VNGKAGVRRAPASAQIDCFRALLTERLGLHLSDAEPGSVAAVLQARLNARGLTAETYLERLRWPGVDRSELGLLADAFTVPETHFFRNSEQVSVLARIAACEWMHRWAGQRPFRILSAGCATGEEAYSIAIALRERLPDCDPSWFEIRAVDVAPSSIARARRARFSPWSLRETPPDVVARWFRRAGREFVLAEEIRSMVSFSEGNLVENDPALWPPAAYDAVFCRNVLMYLTQEQAAAVVQRIGRALRPGGYLFLGYAETLRGLSQDFDLRHTRGAFYYQLKQGSDAPTLEQPHPTCIGSREAIEPFAAAFPSRVGNLSWFESIRHAAERVEALVRRVTPQSSVDTSSMSLTTLGDVMALLERERFAEALEVLHDLPAGLARSPEVLLLRAVLLAHSGRFEEAESVSFDLLGIDESNAGAHYVLALCREGLGDADGAVERDLLAVHLDPGFSMPHLHLGLLARKRGNREAARRELSRALVLLQREDALRLILFGGGFKRDALLALCRMELRTCGGTA
jgi:Methylase of chemotaxis methyl-accepting proteins